MAFNGGSVWMKCTWALVTVGFVVWLAAGQSYSTKALTTTAATDALEAFLIIGVVTYFTAVLLTFLYLFVDETAGNKIVLIVDIVVAFIAGFSAIVCLGIGQAVNFSDRLAYSSICALVAAVFCILELVGGGGGKSAGGAGGSV